MDYRDILQQAMEGKAQIDFTALLTEVINASVMSRCYLKAVLESQVALLMQNGGMDEMDFDAHFKVIMEQIDKESEAQFVEVMQNIIKK